MTSLTPGNEIGRARRRHEDAVFLTGQGQFVDDIVLEDMAHAAILRSPHAHAAIRAVDVGAAAGMPGVLAVLTGADMGAAGIAPLPPAERANEHTGEPFAFTAYPPLATDRVRHVGQPVALVVAETRAQALDAVDQIHVDYAPLAAVTTAAAALADGAVLLSEDVPGNVALRWQVGDAEATDRAFCRCRTRDPAAPAQPSHRDKSHGAARCDRRLRQ